MPKKNKQDAYTRGMAIFVALLFIGSFAGLALYSGGSASSAGVPSEYVLSSPLESQQKQLLISNFRAYIASSIPECGQECDSAAEFVESMTEAYEPFVFVYQQRTADELFITIEGYNGTETFFGMNEFSEDAFEDALCSQLHPSLEQCSTRRVFGELA